VAEAKEAAAGTVARRVHDLVAAEGPIPFARFMEEALYGAGGYYRRPRLAIGEEGGDFVTGSVLSPLFGRSTARLLRRLDGALGRPAALLEAGYGGGEHLAALIDALAGESPSRQLLAWDRVSRPLPLGVEPLAALEAVGEGALDGLIFSYELFDALAVHRLVGRADGSLGELWVAAEGDGFAWHEGELSDPALAELLGGAELAPGQVADLAPGWVPLYHRLARRLGRGLLVTCDYGYRRPALLDGRVRRHGTLACYRHHRVHRDPFRHVGEQDLTAHVDFTALAAAGEAEGLATVTLTRQALWLTACGLFEELAGAGAELRRQAMALLDGEGMGEEIRVLVQARGMEPEAVLDTALLGGAAGRRWAVDR
jgi:SAM-dependent MidA family methyltransferase